MAGALVQMPRKVVMQEGAGRGSRHRLTEWGGCTVLRAGAAGVYNPDGSAPDKNRGDLQLAALDAGSVRLVQGVQRVTLGSELDYGGGACGGMGELHIQDGPQGGEQLVQQQLIALRWQALHLQPGI